MCLLGECSLSFLGALEGKTLFMNILDIGFQFLLDLETGSFVWWSIDQILLDGMMLILMV